MRAYLLTSGAVFALLVVAHVVRLFAEGPTVALKPVFVITTLLAVALTAWAWRLWKQVGGS